MRNKPKTFAFRVSDHDFEVIKEKMFASGMTRERFLTNSAIYSRYCVVGSREHIDRLIKRINDMEKNLKLILEDVLNGDAECATGAITEVKEEYIAMVTAIIELAEQASYDIKK